MANNSSCSQTSTINNKQEYPANMHKEAVKDLTSTPSPQGNIPNKEIDPTYVEDMARALDKHSGHEEDQDMGSHHHERGSGHSRRTQSSAPKHSQHPSDSKETCDQRATLVPMEMYPGTSSRAQPFIPWGNRYLN